MNVRLPPLPADYENRIKRFSEALALVSVGPDSQGREAFLAPDAANAWLAMKTAAEKERLNLLLARQTEILERKLTRSIAWEEILYQSAYPGFSEHHTGRAVDLTDRKLLFWGCRGLGVGVKSPVILFPLFPQNSIAPV
jgi:D-alanyl-D-alanine carboxypeptidase